MRRVITIGLLLPIGTPLLAQDLSEVCPGSAAGTGALLGLLSDAEARVPLPGATVVVGWTRDGGEGRTEVSTSIDGSFTLCHLPLDIELSVVGMIGAMPVNRWRCRSRIPSRGATSRSR